MLKLRDEHREKSVDDASRADVIDGRHLIDQEGEADTYLLFISLYGMRLYALFAVALVSVGVAALFVLPALR